MYCVGQKVGKIGGGGGGRGGGVGGNEKEPKRSTARRLVDYNALNNICTGHSRLHTLKFLKVLLCAQPYPIGRYFLEEYRNTVWLKDFFVRL